MPVVKVDGAVDVLERAVQLLTVQPEPVAIPAESVPPPTFA
jgi:hypothetical protein